MSQFKPDVLIGANTVLPVQVIANTHIQCKRGLVQLSTTNLGDGYLLTEGEKILITQDTSLNVSNKGFSTAIVGLFEADASTPPEPPTIPATAVYLSSVGTAIVGTTNPPLTFTTNPEDANDYEVIWSVTNPEGTTVVAITEDGHWSIDADESGARIAITLKNKDDSTVTDSSGVTTSTLGMATDSTTAVSVGGTYQVVATVSPSDLITDFGNEVVVTYFSNDEAIATIDPITGIATGVTAGDTRLGATVTFRGVTASDSSYFQVNA